MESFLILERAMMGETERRKKMEQWSRGIDGGGLKR
jgi:hypothetical protein